MAKVIGIDLGTTNSVCAIMEGGEPTVIPTIEGGRLCPSVVAFTKDGERLIGQPAKRQAVTNPANTLFAVKRLIGRKYDSDEVKWARTLVPYAIVEADNGDAAVKILDRVHSPPEISALILREMPQERLSRLRRDDGQAWDLVIVPNAADDWVPELNSDFAQRVEPVCWIRRPTRCRAPVCRSASPVGPSTNATWTYSATPA